MKRFFIFCFLSTLTIYVMAQKDRQYIRSGNRLYRQQNYAKAEAEYRKSLVVNPNNSQAMYNLGCALMMQKKDSAAIIQYEKAGRAENSPKRKANVYHNIGVVCQSHQMYAEAIKAYEESLRNNPADNETRYNLALCKKLLKQQPKNNNQNKNKDKNKDNNSKNKNKQEKQKQRKNSPQKSKKQMSKDNAEQLLNAAMQEEQATRQRMKRDETHHSRQRRLQKNW